MYKQGDILLIPIPFSDLSATKKRPVLVFSNDRYNSITDDIIVVAITSNISNKFSEIAINDSDMQEGTMKVKSCIRVDKIYTISKSIIVKKFGSVKPNKIDEIRTKFMELV